MHYHSIREQLNNFFIQFLVVGWRSSRESQQDVFVNKILYAKRNTSYEQQHWNARAVE